MTTVDESWTGLSGLDSGSDKYKLIASILSSANFEYLEKQAVISRRKYDLELSSDVDCRVDRARFASGYMNLVMEIVFADGVCWVARIPYREPESDPATTKTSVLSEIATMRIVSSRTKIPVPKIFDFELSGDQPFGYPYVLMQRMAGRAMHTRLAASVPQPYHSQVAKQLASILCELQNLSFDRIGRLWCGETAEQPVQVIDMAWHHSRGPLDTSFEYFYNQRQAENKEIAALHPNDPDWRTASWVLKMALSHIIIEDRVRGPFPLCHLDFHRGNLLFDEEYNLTGVIDWSNSQAAPIEQLAVCPEFITYPSAPKEENEQILKFKGLVTHFMKEMEGEKIKNQPLEVQNGDGQQHRHLTQLSSFLETKRAEITLRCFASPPSRALPTGRIVSKLMYDNKLTWEQLRDVYGNMPIY